LRDGGGAILFEVSGVALFDRGVKAGLRGVAEGERGWVNSFDGEGGACFVDILRSLRASVGLIVLPPRPLILPDFLLSDGVSVLGVFDLFVTLTLTERRWSGSGRSVKVADRGNGCSDFALEERVGAANEMSEDEGCGVLRALVVVIEGVRERSDSGFLSDWGAMGLRVTRAVMPEAAMAGAPGPVWLPLLARTGRTEVEAEVCSWFGAVVER
jgi:hypothetical protein